MISKLFQKLLAIIVFLLVMAGLTQAQSSDRAYRVDTFSTSGSPNVNIST